MDGEGIRYCPLCKREIDIDLCADICFVAEHISPEWMLPTGLEMTDDNRSTCMDCANHID